MQWRTFTIVLARRSFAASIPCSKSRFPRGLRTFQSIAGDTATKAIEAQDIPQIDPEDLEVMAQTKREVKQLQQLLGLVPSDKEAKDVIFVCIDCEAFEFDQTKITEIGASNLLNRYLMLG